MSKQILSGDEAIARGAYEAGCIVATAYPGTPSTEILENIAAYGDAIYSQWATNEKVAVEIAIGASIGGARALASMKHVGMNVASDPIFSIGYAGVNAGLVIISADDPGCHSSQNEQDNRNYAPHAKIAMLEPADSQECKDFTVAAFELSERFDTPVLLRLTTRICHSKSLVETGERKEEGIRPYLRRPEKHAMLPATARSRHIIREKLLLEMEEYSNNCPFNKIERQPQSRIGIITSGISYQYSREIFGKDANYLKIGLSYPLPNKLIAGFAKDMETLYVIEENDPYLENAVKRLGFSCTGKDKIPICGELSTEIIRKALFNTPDAVFYKSEVKVPPRPPVLCAGCPHRGFFSTLNKHLSNIVPAGDIGCYSLGFAPPFNGFDFSVCMGAGLSSIIGLSKALERQGDKRKALGMVGDSTFFHSGITSLIDIVTSNANVIACILDNSTTAMTGHQDHSGTGKTIQGASFPAIDIAALVKATGISNDRLRIVDPINTEEMNKAIADGIAINGPFIIITKSPCALLPQVVKANAGRHCEVDPDACRGCRACTKTTCPSIAFIEGKSVIRDRASCNGCGLCRSQCKFNAIKRVEAQNG